MILYRKEPYHLQMKNIMLLDDVKSGGVVYVSKPTYDQALMLSSRFDGSVQRVIDALKCKKTEAYVATIGLPQLINEMSKTMPEPINILAPFLMFCTCNQGIEWSADKREMAYGILHQYSQMIDFNSMLLVPADVRANVSFPTALLMQYEISWNDLCSTLKDRVVEVSIPATQTVVQQSAPVTNTPAPSSVPIETAKPIAEETKSDKPKEEELSPIERRILEMRQRKEKEHEALLKKEKEQQAIASAPKPTAVQKNSPAEQANTAAANSVLDQYDF